MPAPKSDEYWAIFAARYVEYCGLVTNPAAAMGEEMGVQSRGISTAVGRLKAKGFLENDYSIRRPRLTQKTLDILAHVKDMQARTIVFDVKVAAATKEEALAQVWDAVVQLENWNPKEGAFQYRPARLEMLGEKQ